MAKADPKVDRRVVIDQGAGAEATEVVAIIGDHIADRQSIKMAEMLHVVGDHQEDFSAGKILMLFDITNLTVIMVDNSTLIRSIFEFVLKVESKVCKIRSTSIH